MKEQARTSYINEKESTRHLANIINQLIKEHPHHNVITVTSAYTADGLYRVVLVDCTGGAVTVTLKSFADWEGSFSFQKIDATANAMTIDAAGSETINGAANVSTTTQWGSFTVVSNGVSGNSI